MNAAIVTTEELRVQETALGIVRLVLLDRYPVSLGPGILPHAYDLPAHFDAGDIGAAAMMRGKV